MDKPSTPLNNINEFIKGKIKEETYFSRRTNNRGKFVADWPELELLKFDMDLFREYLLAFSLKGRFIVLLRKQLLGITSESLYQKYGIPKDKLAVLKGEKESRAYKENGTIRTIKHSQLISEELYATLALFTRLPVSWLKEETPNKQHWDVDYFSHFPNAQMNIDEFLYYLEQTEKETLENLVKHTRPNNNWIYDIRGIELNITPSYKILLRVTVYERGGFSIESFGGNDEIYCYTVLKDILSSFAPIKTGYVKTVIKERVNLVIICESRSIKSNQFPLRVYSL